MTKKWMVSFLTMLGLVTVAPTFAQLYRPPASATQPATTTTTTTPATTTLTTTTTVAPVDSGRYRIAVFTPLYLDSAFDAAGNYRYDAKTFPKQSSAGLEFWEGAELAIDSLRREGVQLDIHVYDIKANPYQLDTIFAGEDFKTTDLIIGQVTANEAAKLAHVADTLNVPFINANLPNDAGVTNNPQYIILNSTLPTHCVGIYRFLQKNYSLQTITVFRKKGALEDRLKNYFTDFEKTTAVKLKIKWVTLDDNNITADELAPYLTEDKANICVAGSLDAQFAQNLCQQLALKGTPTTPNVIIGMPTWDVIDFEKSQYKNLEIIYSTPFYVAPAGKLATTVYEDFKDNFYSRPSDMVFRGFETVYHFSHLLSLYGKNLGNSLSDKKYMLFGEFDIQPVINKTTMTLDYFENKKLYFVKKVDGLVKTVY